MEDDNLAKKRGIEVLRYKFEGGKIAAMMPYGYCNYVVLNQDSDFPIADFTLRAGDVCRIGKFLVIIAGFSDDNNSYNPENKNLWDLTKAWVMPQKILCSMAGHEIMPFSRHFLEMKGIEVIKKTEVPLTLKTTKPRIIEFLHSET